ncbi:hypothetical protein JCM8208_001930 [Rhodotorula glutinis]
MSSSVVKLEGDGAGVLSAQLDKLILERDKVAASLHRLDPSGELRPIWNMLKNPSRSGHGYWDLLGMEQHVYEQHPPQTPGVATASAATRQRRRDHGLLLEGRLAELNHEIVALGRELRPVGPAPVDDKFFPVARPQTLLPLQVLQQLDVVRTLGGMSQVAHATANLRARTALQEELDTLRSRDARLQAALDRLDPTKQLRALWLVMHTPVKAPGTWFDQVDLERKIYASGSRSSSSDPSPTDEQITSRRNQGMLLLGRLAELSHEIADAERELVSLDTVKAEDDHGDHDLVSHARSIGHTQALGWRGAARYRASGLGRSLRC